jgi:hypothetical protein
MAGMGHDSERAAMIYQHDAQGADQAITNAIDTHVQPEQEKRGSDEDGSAGVPGPSRRSGCHRGRPSFVPSNRFR